MCWGEGLVCWREGLAASEGIALKVISRMEAGSEGAVSNSGVVGRCFLLCHAGKHTNKNAHTHCHMIHLCA